jgi:hypothetical protein
MACQACTPRSGRPCNCLLPMCITI